jgi:murein endopeptidase
VRFAFLLLVLTLAAQPAEAFLDPGSGAVAPSMGRREAIDWRNSAALGTPSAGRLVRGVRLPAEGPLFYTWDPLLHRRPDRAWRRWGTDALVRVVLQVVRAYARAHPAAARVGIGDLSRPRGGYFGPRHASHQNGLDVDVYYPRLDRRERPPKTAAQIDRRLAQELVDRFVAHGAERIFVGPGTGLTGPPAVVQVLGNHDNHMHVRIPPYNPRGWDTRL